MLDNARDILAQAGMTFDNVVASRVYITDGTKFQEMNKTYTTYFTSKPPARATVIAPLTGPQYQVEITLTASSLPKEVFTTPAADGTPGKPNPILSSAMKVGNRLYVAGLLGNTAEQQGQHRSADQGDHGAGRAHDEAGGLRLGRRRRRDRLHHRHQQLQCDEQRDTGRCSPRTSLLARR